MVLSAEWSQVEVIELINDGNGLGFILVGGRSTGVVIKALMPGGVAERDGRLQCGDHLLQIGEVNLRGFSSEQVATVLRQSGAQVRLVVARPAEPKAIEANTLPSHAPIVPTKHLSDPDELTRHLFEYTATGKRGSLKQQQQQQEQEQEEEVAMEEEKEDEHNNNNSSRSSTNGRPEENGNGPGEEAENNINHCLSTNHLVNSASIGFTPLPDTELADLPLPPIPKELAASAEHIYHSSMDLDIIPFSIVSPPCSITPTLLMDQGESAHFTLGKRQSASSPTATATSSPETETYQVTLRKNVYGLGITVAGYVCEEEDVSGVFVKSIIEGSCAEVSGGHIQINDRIVAVDGISLAGVSNHQAVEILRNTDIEVKLTLERFLRGRKFEHLQVALTELKDHDNGADADDATNEQNSQPPSPSIATLSWLPPKSDADSVTTDGDAMEYADLPSRNTFDSSTCLSLEAQRKEPSSPQPPLPLSTVATAITTSNMANDSVAQIDSPLASNIPEDESAAINGNMTTIASINREELRDTEIKANSPREEKQIGFRPVMRTVHANALNAAETEAKAETTPPEAENRGKRPMEQAVVEDVAATGTAAKDSLQRPQSMVAVSSVDTLKVAWKSLGISLEGTVDVECGIEKRPHHYIRSILEDGPVGRQGILKPGDELLQVNEYKLQGLKHTEVVKILKELPSHVKLVCVRGSTAAPSIINTSQNAEAFETRSLLPGGHQSLQNLQNLLTAKAQSESSLYTSSTATLTDQLRSKSLENVSGLALWSTDVTFVEIEKTEQGFGFSILDYQDPLDPDGSVIVIRGLIPGGSAEATNNIFPGDRLVSVGEYNLQGLELDAAVTILKGMPQGLTRLGICRPLSTSDSNIETPNGEGDSTST